MQQYFFDENGQAKKNDRNTKLDKLIKEIMNEQHHVIDVAELFDKLVKDELTLGGIDYIYNDERRTSQNIILILLTLV